MLLLFAAVAVGAADGSFWEAHPLADPEAVCINGAPAQVAVNISDTSLWVIQIGGASPGIDFCISLDACKMLAPTPSGPPPPPPPPPVFSPPQSGPQSRDCATNPDWCKASMVSIPDQCSFDFLMGDNVYNENGTTLHFKGIKILQATVKKLATLGLDKAEKVLLTGFAQAGVAVYLHADRLQALVKAVAPKLTVFKALPADGLKARLQQTFFCESGIMQGNCHPADGSMPPILSWYDDALKQNAKLSGAAANVAPGCAKRNAGKEYLCLYANETLPEIATPIFAVNQLLSVWDAQCVNEGQPVGNILQIGCSARGNYFKDLYTCVQYPDLCNPAHVKNWWAPAQEQYLADFARSGVLQKPGNGGFLHQCYLGSYFEESAASTDPARAPKPKPGVWDQIAVGGKTMREAITDWWGGTGAYLADKAWDSAGVPPGAAPPSVNLSAVGEPGVDAPVVPWYTARWMTNPSCRGYPWY